MYHMKLKCQKQPEYLASQNHIFLINTRLVGQLFIWIEPPRLGEASHLSQILFISYLPEEIMPTG